MSVKFHDVQRKVGYQADSRIKMMSHFLLRAGENWQENPETYEDSFYKRSLDNDNYVFTAPYFNSKYCLEFSHGQFPSFK